MFFFRCPLFAKLFTPPPTGGELIDTYSIVGSGGSAVIDVLEGDVIVALSWHKTQSGGTNPTLTNLGTHIFGNGSTLLGLQYVYVYEASSDGTITPVLSGDGDSHAIFAVFRGVTVTGMDNVATDSHLFAGPAKFGGSLGDFVAPGAGGLAIGLAVTRLGAAFTTPSIGYTFTQAQFPGGTSQPNGIIEYKVSSGGNELVQGDTNNDLTLSPDSGWRTYGIGLPPV